MNEIAKPGCYSSPLCFDATTTPCSVCNWRHDCGPASIKVSDQLRERFGIDKVGARKAAPARKPIMVAPATVKPVTIVDGSLPKKAMDLIQSMQRMGVDLADAVKNNRNPFLTRPPAYMRTLVARLLDGGFTRREAKDLLMKVHGWTEPTASSHMSFAVAAMISLGVAKEEDGCIVKKES